MPDWDDTPPQSLAAAAAPDNTAPAALAASAGQSNAGPGVLGASAGQTAAAPGVLAASGAVDNTAPDAEPAAEDGSLPFTGDTTDNQAIIADVSAEDIATLAVGMGVRGAGVPAGATIAALGVDMVTLSAPATATAAGVTLRAYAVPETVAAGPAMDNGAPAALAAVAAQDNTAPTVLPEDAAQSGIAPGALAAGAGPDNGAPSALPASGAQTSQPPQFVVGPIDNPTDNTVNTPQIVIGGALVANAIHGQTRIALDSALTRVQVQLDDPPTGSAAILQLVDGDGVAIGGPINIADGEKFGELVLAEEDYIGLAAGADVRIKCIQPGAVNAGGFGAATLYLQLA